MHKHFIKLNRYKIIQSNSIKILTVLVAVHISLGTSNKPFMNT